MPDSPAIPQKKFDAELEKHLKALGLNSAQEYQEWCARNGFSIRIDKHWRERGKERFFFAQAAVQSRVARKRQERRNPRAILIAIFDRRFEAPDLTQPHLASICRLVATHCDEPTRDAFRRLVLHAEGRTNLLSTHPALPQEGARNGNTWIEGLFSLARSHQHWIRPIEAWNKRVHNPRRQFATLARHLVAKYPVPAFMDAVWLQGDTADAAKPQRWFIDLAGGTSVRKLDLPIPLTRRMAHCFLTAPPDYSVAAALRWGQIVGLGGDARLVRSILGSRIAADFNNNDFWLSVISWLIRNPQLRPALIAPLIDYIQRRRFGPVETPGRDGIREAQPADPNFTMKGRTAESLLRQMVQWHVDLWRRPKGPYRTWDSSGIGGFQLTEGTEGANAFRRWTIIELVSSSALVEEARMMRHCVASYEQSCAFGGTSIWSLGVEGNTGRRRRVLTIEVATRSKTICQIRGQANRLPRQSEMLFVARWAAQEGLTFAKFI